MLAVTSQASASQRREKVERTELRMSSLLTQYAAKRDPVALQAIIEQHAALVYSTCLRIVGDPHLADDAGQAVFLIFTRKAATLRADTPLPAWFYRTAVFVAQRANRERRTRQRYEQEAAAMRAQTNQTGDTQRALWAELKPKLDELLETLPNAERDAIVLRYLAGKSEPEAAQALGCPVGTLSARVSRALAKLRRRLGGSAAALPPAVLGLAVEQHATHAAPAHFVSFIHAACLGTAGASASVAAKALAEGTMKALFWLKLKVVLAVLLISALIGVPVTMKLAAGESGPVVKGDKAPPAPPVPVIPKTISFGPRPQKQPLIYERVTQTDCTERPAITAVMNGLVPEHAVDCQIFALTTKDEKDGERISVECLKAFFVKPYSYQEKDGKQTVVNLVSMSDSGAADLPACSVTYKPNGTSAVTDFTDQVPLLKIVNPGITGTMSFRDGGLGMLMLHHAGFIPVCSTAGKARAVHDTWVNTNLLLDRYELPITYSLEKLDSVDGRLLAIIKSLPKVTEMNPEVLPTETVGIGTMTVTLAPKVLSGQCNEELLVDVERGVVLHHSRVVNCKLGYKLDLPESMPEAIRKMAGSDLVLGMRFTIEDTLLDPAESELLLKHNIVVAKGLKNVQERWTKRQADGPELVKDLANVFLMLIKEEIKNSARISPPNEKAHEPPQKDEF